MGVEPSLPPASATALINSLGETDDKIKTFVKSLHLHLTSDEFDSKSDDLDFLHAKNSMMLCYLLDLTHLIRLTSGSNDEAKKKKLEACVNRLNEMRVAMERMRPMEKKLRYQMDRLLSLSSGSFAVVNEDTTTTLTNALTFRPNLDGMFDEGEEEEADSDRVERAHEDDMDDDEVESGDDEDNDLKAAKESTNTNAHSRHSTTKAPPTTALYQPPRLVSTSIDAESKDEKLRNAQLRRQRQQMSRNTELLHTLRSNYTDAPEEDDLHGGAVASSASSHNRARRRLEEQQRNRTELEESQFVRLTMSRKQRKEENRVVADERSNLKELSELGNLTRGILAFGESQTNHSHEPQKSAEEWEGRFDNGKRKRGRIVGDSMLQQRVNKGGESRARGKFMQNGNALQRELYGVQKGGSKKKKKSKK